MRADSEACVLRFARPGNRCGWGSTLTRLRHRLRRASPVPAGRPLPQGRGVGGDFIELGWKGRSLWSAATRPQADLAAFDGGENPSRRREPRRRSTRGPVCLCVIAPSFTPPGFPTFGRDPKRRLGSPHSKGFASFGSDSGFQQSRRRRACGLIRKQVFSLSSLRTPPASPWGPPWGPKALRGGGNWCSSLGCGSSLG